VLESGQIFANRYRVDRQIAEGGMGAIFEAEHTATERRVALKLLFPHIMSVASARQKFELEARISARVNSPYIVEVLDAGFDEATKSPYLVMELLQGQTVADYVEQRGPLGADEALPLLEQMADGLDAAHGYREPNGTVKPIVHRDLKPENVFMAREHGQFSVKILDFGIAKVLGETSNVSQEVRGTPMYMAVEQITAGVLSPQTDVWALGLIAYYMLTGKPYWKSANSETANVQSLFAEILSLPIDAPSLRVREQNSSVALPPAFDAWLLKCIDRAPSRRYASAGLAVEELARAFRRTTRARKRPSTRAAARPFAATEAVVAPTPPQVKPAAKAGTAASLPGMASEHRSFAGIPAPLSRTPLFAAAAAGLLVLAGGAWFAFAGRETPSAALPAPAAAAAPAAAPATAAAAAPAPAPAAAPAAAPAPAAAAAPAPVRVAVAVADPPAPISAPAPKPKRSSARPAPARSTPRRPEPVALPAPAYPPPPAPAPVEPPPKKASASDAYKMR
jgi:serine/threonine-protein kinase